MNEKSQKDAFYSRLFPEDDGWVWLYKCCIWFKNPRLKLVFKNYFWPKKFELDNRHKFYRLLGVHYFGRFVPTGGIAIRRLFHSKMTPYTLSSTSFSGALSFYYRTCIFESLHIPFMLALFFIIAQRIIAGNYLFAFENLIINMIANVYPIMHHRHTRARIVRLLKKRRTIKA